MADLENSTAGDSLSTCEHSVQVFGLCAQCGLDLSSSPSSLLTPTISSPIFDDLNNDEDVLNTPLNSSSLHHVLHDNPHLKVTLAEAERLDRELVQRLHEERRLSLVIDLDQTVIHAAFGVVKTNLTEHEHVITLFDGSQYSVKLRPHLGHFLETLDSLYEMHIYTMGSRQYASAIIPLIDPSGKFFHSRVLTRDENDLRSSNTTSGLVKDLRRIFPCNDRQVAIIDDRIDVWTACPNLLPIRPYCYYIKDERLGAEIVGTLNDVHDDVVKRTHKIRLVDDDTELLRHASILQRIHAQYYTELDKSADDFNFSPPDVKEILRSVKQCIFQACFPTNVTASNQPIWRIAEQYGARCLPDLVPGTTTHLLAAKNDTDKVRIASSLAPTASTSSNNDGVSSGGSHSSSSSISTPFQFPLIRIVSPEWLYECVYEWNRVDETPFTVTCPTLHGTRGKVRVIEDHDILTPALIEDYNDYDKRLELDKEELEDLIEGELEAISSSREGENYTDYSDDENISEKISSFSSSGSQIVDGNGVAIGEDESEDLDFIQRLQKGDTDDDIHLAKRPRRT